jgi:hypothetical protein
MTPQIVQILERPGTEIHVCYHPGEHDHVADLYGWIAVDHGAADWPLVHYCYVKRNFRNEGIARGLFAAAGVVPTKPFLYSARTDNLSERWARDRIPRARWQPQLARGDHGPNKAKKT